MSPLRRSRAPTRPRPRSLAAGGGRDLALAVRAFRGIEVLVAGDLFLDEYIEGEMFEISKEGPIPVIRIEGRVRTPGAAGNLAASLRNLGARVRVVGVVGRDPNGGELLALLEKKGVTTRGVIVDRDRPTFTYSKLRARVENTPSREILRMDVLPPAPLDRETEEKAIRAVEKEAAGARGILVLDQVHHLISKGVLRELPRIARARGALLHGSSRDHIGDYRGFDLITPNDREAHGAVGGDPADVENLGRKLKTVGRHRKVVLTLGERGMLVFPERGRIARCPTLARTVVDVTGAGDAVSSVALLANIAGWNAAEIARAASHAAAIAVEHVGTHHVSLEELEERLRDGGD